jgi:hypothetical protein
MAANIHRSCVLEPKGNSILVIYANTPMTGPVTLQFLKPIARALQIVETDRSVENIEFPNDDRPYSDIDFSRRFRIPAVVDVLRCLI